MPWGNFIHRPDALLPNPQHPPQMRDLISTPGQIQGGATGGKHILKQTRHHHVLIRGNAPPIPRHTTVIGSEIHHYKILNLHGQLRIHLWQQIHHLLSGLECFQCLVHGGLTNLRTKRRGRARCDYQSECS